MPSSLASALTAAMTTVRAVAGAAVTYHRGSASVSLTAVPGRRNLDAQLDGGIVEQASDQDWLVKATDIVLSGVVVIPRPGDRIKRQVGTAVQLWDVMTPPYRPSDSDATQLRISTLYVGVE